MELKVNGQHVDITLEGEKSVGEVLKAFEEEAAKNNATTISIKIDGKDIPAEDFEKAVASPIKENTLIELSVITKGEILELLKTSKDGLKETASSLKEISVLLQNNRDGEVNQIVSRLAGEIDSFCHAATLSALFPDLYSLLKIEDKEIGEFFEEFAPVLRDFEEAFENKDTVTTGDLAEYEIAPRLEAVCSSLEKL